MNQSDETIKALRKFLKISGCTLRPSFRRSYRYIFRLLFLNTVTDAERRAMRKGRVRVHRQRAGAARYVDDASRRRFTKEWKHRLRNGDDAEHVRLEHRANLVERRDARALRLHHLLERPARLSRMRDGRVVHQHVETAELVPDALCRGGDGGLIRDVELEGAGIRSDALRGSLPTLEVARPD